MNLRWSTTHDQNRDTYMSISSVCTKDGSISKISKDLNFILRPYTEIQGLLLLIGWWIQVMVQHKEKRCDDKYNLFILPLCNEWKASVFRLNSFS